MKKNLLLLTVLIFSAILAGCGGGARIVNINFQTDNDSNGSNAIVVDVYQLKSQDKFTHASFESLLRNPQGILTDDLIPNSSKEITMVPGESYEVKNITLSNDAQYIGIIGNFHSPAQNGWRQIIPVNSDFKNLKVLVHQNYLSVQK